MKSIVALSALLICAAAPAAELHPIVEVQNGYLFGATADGKWIKAEEAAKALTDETTYRIYGLTQSLGQAKEGKPKPSEEDVCSDVLTVSLSPKLDRAPSRWPRPGMRCRGNHESQIKLSKFMSMRCGIF
jgi:hypothetical protein